ncbi:hypothetical protein [Asticcacaulis sp. AND118]|uniref:hypothetical protein n=1 Tax=Asticcacaulis sp. AND118 TaxID=2840468 RepID=UPI001D0007B3|nr:hypothetical protein [Asticcacaulis sp. AND118]UDF04226.1 hypothetical protein LH365_04065 [Asticcacaulis sp. AND118]
MLPAALLPILEALSGDPAVHTGRALKTEGLMVGGKLFAFVMDEHLVLKLPVAEVDALMAATGAHRLSRGGSPMKEWVCLPPASQDLWLAKAAEAKAFVQSLR